MTTDATNQFLLYLVLSNELCAPFVRNLKHDFCEYQEPPCKHYKLSKSLKIQRMSYMYERAHVHQDIFCIPYNHTKLPIWLVFIATYRLVKSYNHCCIHHDICKRYKKFTKYCKSHENLVVIFSFKFVYITIVNVRLCFTPT